MSMSMRMKRGLKIILKNSEWVKMIKKWDSGGRGEGEGERGREMLMGL